MPEVNDCSKVLYVLVFDSSGFKHAVLAIVLQWWTEGLAWCGNCSFPKRVAGSTRPLLFLSTWSRLSSAWEITRRECWSVFCPSSTSAVKSSSNLLSFRRRVESLGNRGMLLPSNEVTSPSTNRVLPSFKPGLVIGLLLSQLRTFFSHFAFSRVSDWQKYFRWNWKKRWLNFIEIDCLCIWLPWVLKLSSFSGIYVEEKLESCLIYDCMTSFYFSGFANFLDVNEKSSI